MLEFVDVLPPAIKFIVNILNYMNANEVLRNIDDALPELYSQILNVPSQDVDNQKSFLELGGNSLKAMILLSQIKERWGVKVPLEYFFTNSDVISISKYIKEEYGSEIVEW